MSDREKGLSTLLKDAYAAGLRSGETIQENRLREERNLSFGVGLMIGLIVGILVASFIVMTAVTP